MNDEYEDWWDGLRPGAVRGLFDTLPNLLFFAKDIDLRLMSVNQAFVRHCGCSQSTEVLGRTDPELFPLELAEKYREDDRKVLESGEPLSGIVEMFPNPMGEPEWFVTDKIPLFARDGSVAGLCGTVRSYEGARAELQPYLDLLPATEYIKVHFAEKIPMEKLARLAGMSVRQMERRFLDTFQLTPGKYIHRLRILKACDLLVSTRMQITAIALELGYYDHSAFSKRFSEMMGLSPNAYRKKSSR